MLDDVPRGIRLIPKLPSNRKHQATFLTKGAVKKSWGGTARYAERQQESRKAILAAAHRLFAARGFQRTSMDDIADLAPASTATIYAHFASKEILLAGIVEDMFADMPCVPIDPQQDRGRQARIFLNSMVLAGAKHLMHDLAGQGYEGAALPVLERWLNEADKEQALVAGPA